MKQNLVLTLKNRDGEVVKEVKAQTFDLRFSTIDNLMLLLDISEETTSFELLKKVSKAWKEITLILDDIFPEMEKEDWTLVKLNDLVPIVLQIVKYTFSEIMSIPTDSKN